MTPEKRDLTDRANKILTALREAGDWVSREQLAGLIGHRKKLSNNDLIVLRRLKNDDLIEIRQHTRKPKTRITYEYKAK